MASEEKIKVVFILGSGHCGSTLLDMLLGSHPDIAGVGEIDMILAQRDITKCSCGEMIGSCPVWSEKIADVSNWKGMRPYRNKLNTLLNIQSHKYIENDQPVKPKTFCSHQVELYEHVLSSQKVDIIVDSSKNADRFTLLDQCETIEPIIVHIVRDGRGVLWSYKKKYDRTFAFIWKWIAENLKVELSKLRSDSKSVTIKYRDLCESPERELRRILTKMDVNYKSSMLDFRSADHHQVSGNRMRLSDSSEIEEDLSWRKQLSFSNKMLFWLIAGWLQFYYFVYEG